MLLKLLTPQVTFSIFTFLQIFTISIYLSNKTNEKISFDVYLQTVKFSTLFLLLISIVLLIKYRNRILKFESIKFVFLLQILILYFTMLIHTDIKAINSPTILLMGVSFLIFSSIKVTNNFLNKISIILAVFNLLFALLQVIKIIPVAQINERENFGLSDNRPTGLLFNAFALGYASAIIFIICLYFLLSKINIYLNMIGLASSLTTLVLSATRTPLFLILILGLIVVLQKNRIIYKNWKLISFLTFFLIIFFPVFLIIYGNYRSVESYSTLNGRVFLWECVMNKWEEFIPFGVGVEAAFPKGFCSDDPWFANLRHPESMFLLNFVEAGAVGLFGLVVLFVFTFWESAKVLRTGNALPLATSSIFLMCCIFYVPLFHYIPFLENRPADRGVFNFFIFSLLWLMTQVLFLKSKQNINKN